MIYVAFHANWSDPPGEVVETFATREEADHYCNEQWAGYGYSVVEIPLPIQSPA